MRFGQASMPFPKRGSRDALQKLERATGIEPAWPAWKAGTLPLSYARLRVEVILRGTKPCASFKAPQAVGFTSRRKRLVPLYAVGVPGTKVPVGTVVPSIWTIFN